MKENYSNQNIFMIAVAVLLLLSGIAGSIFVLPLILIKNIYNSAITCFAITVILFFALRFLRRVYVKKCFPITTFVMAVGFILGILIPICVLISV